MTDNPLLWSSLVTIEKLLGMRACILIIDYWYDFGVINVRRWLVRKRSAVKKTNGAFSIEKVSGKSRLLVKWMHWDLNDQEVISWKVYVVNI